MFPRHRFNPCPARPSFTLIQLCDNAPRILYGIKMIVLLLKQRAHLFVILNSAYTTTGLYERGYDHETTTTFWSHVRHDYDTTAKRPQHDISEKWACQFFKNVVLWSCCNQTRYCCHVCDTTVIRQVLFEVWQGQFSEMSCRHGRVAAVWYGTCD